LLLSKIKSQKNSLKVPHFAVLFLIFDKKEMAVEYSLWYDEKKQSSAVYSRNLKIK